MARRIEAGPLVVALGAILLLVSLFLEWFEPGLTAWTAFEALDLVLAAIAIAALLAALGLIAPNLATLDRRWLAPLAVAALVIIGSQVLNPPPGAGNGDIEPGGWLGLAGALLMCAGALLSFSKVRFAVTVEGRDPRRRVQAVDARASAPPPAAVPADPDQTLPISPAPAPYSPPPPREP
ncbi:MAG: hypothetical protein AVDCRST_MAG30-3819 [uncultured Solirubrobacteraceae bacterium]|uniref:Uncharacterized protein n=1 Tax=uncultured Solirubrobacteraceae bacterium TaxID=1162706 RepID=A0A6J4TSI9_9ACTN|nr:MAG: hypothetical protein AVDCRST_MAG30-3819 [uncultured Solirubrobacteraceae bacterium]